MTDINDMFGQLFSQGKQSASGFNAAESCLELYKRVGELERRLAEIETTLKGLSNDQ